MRWIAFVILATNLALVLPAQAQENDQLGRQYYDISDYKKAASIFEKLYKKKPNQQRYDYLRKCYLYMGEYEEAEDLCKKHFKKFRLLTVKVDLGEVYLYMDNLNSAESVFNEAIDEVRQQPNQAISIAQAFTRIQQFDYALACYQVARNANPRQILNFQMADLYSQMGDIDMVFQEYVDVLEINEGYLQSVKNMLSRMVSDDPMDENNQKLRLIILEKVQQTNNPIYNDLLIWLFIQESNFEAALRHVKAEDRRTRGDQSGVWELARTCKNNKEWDLALECYEYIIEKGEDSPYYMDSRIAKLRVLRMKVVERNDYTQQELVELKTMYNLAIEEFGIHGQTILMLRDLAHLEAFYLRDTEQAKVWLEQAIVITNAPQLSIAQCKLELADILLLENEVWDAILLYAQVEKDFKEDIIGQEAKFRRAKVNYYLGDFNWAQAQLDVLKASTSKLIANDAMYLSLLIGDNLNLDTTDHPLYLYARADLMRYQNRMDMAWEKLDSLEEMYPTHGLMDEVKFMRADIRITQRDWAGAAHYYQQVVDQHSWDLLGDDAHFRLAEIYEYHLGEPQKAMELYEQLILRYPGSIYTVESRKRFRTLRGDKLDTEG
jgi:tetratricopeptide (TPR) repeat protein